MLGNLVLESFSTKSIDRKRKSNNSVNDTKESSRPFKSRKTNIFEIKNNKGENSLVLALKNGHYDIAMELLGAGSNPAVKIEGLPVLTWFFKKGNGFLKQYKYLILFFLKSNKCIEISNSRGITALMWSSWTGYTKGVLLLIKAGADLDIQTKYGNTALIGASQQGHTETVRLLLEADADPNIQTKYENTALMMASGKGHTEIVRDLIKAGADPNIQNNNGWTALMMASYRGHKEIVRILLSAESSIIDSADEL